MRQPHVEESTAAVAGDQDEAAAAAENEVAEAASSTLEHTPPQPVCRVCMDSCSERLKCKCDGYGHTRCIEAWVRARAAARRSRSPEMWTVADLLACEICTADYGLVPPPPAGSVGGGGGAGEGGGGDGESEVRNARISALLEMGEAEAAQLADPAAGAPATRTVTTRIIVLAIAATLVLGISLVCFPVKSVAFIFFIVIAILMYAAAGCAALQVALLLRWSCAQVVDYYVLLSWHVPGV